MKGPKKSGRKFCDGKFFGKGFLNMKRENRGKGAYFGPRKSDGKNF